MIFFTPEEDLEVYNKLTEYYDIAEDLSTRLNENQEITLKQKRDILFPIIDEIKELADNLIESYILHLKDEDNMDKLLKVKENINLVLKKIDYFKNKIYDVYKINNKDAGNI